MSSDISINAETRTLLGKRVKQLRAAGKVPAVMYGPESEPVHLTVDSREMRAVLLRAGGTQLVNLKIDGSSIPVLVRSVQRDPLRDHLMHIDFYRVIMNRPIRAEVPLVLLGEPELVASNDAIISQLLTSVEVEALPANLPENIEVNTEVLTDFDTSVLVKDLILPDGVIVTLDPEELVVKLDYAVQLETAEEMDQAEPEVLTERKDEDEG